MAFLHGVRNIVKSVGLGDLTQITVENDKIEFDPETYNNIVIIVRGHMHGSITLLRDDHESKRCKINNKIYVTDDYIRVTITPVYTDNQLVLTIEVITANLFYYGDNCYLPPEISFKGTARIYQN
jgi:hypothetical protein